MKILVGIVTLVVIISAVAATQFIHEDSMLWNCYLMGNHQCGEANNFVRFILGK
jgi:hypothetical protein